MAKFAANNPTKTVTIHKDNCRIYLNKKLDPCGCGERGNLGNQQWFCEEHMTLEKIDDFMNHRHWAFIPCDVCFKESSI